MWIGRIKQSPDFAEIMREHVAQRFEFFEHSLADREWIAGAGSFTVADITALCAIDFGGKVSNIRIDPAATPNLAAWHARVSARPSSKA